MRNEKIRELLKCVKDFVRNDDDIIRLVNLSDEYVKILLEKSRENVGKVVNNLMDREIIKLAFFWLISDSPLKDDINFVKRAFSNDGFILKKILECLGDSFIAKVGYSVDELEKIIENYSAIFLNKEFTATINIETGSDLSIHGVLNKYKQWLIERANNSTPNQNQIGKNRETETQTTISLIESYLAAVSRGVGIQEEDIKPFLLKQRKPTEPSSE